MTCLKMKSNPWTGIDNGFVSSSTGSLQPSSHFSLHLHWAQHMDLYNCFDIFLCICLGSTFFMTIPRQSFGSFKDDILSIFSTTLFITVSGHSLRIRMTFFDFSNLWTFFVIWFFREKHFFFQIIADISVLLDRSKMALNFVVLFLNNVEKDENSQKWQLS